MDWVWSSRLTVAPQDLKPFRTQQTLPPRDDGDTFAVLGYSRTRLYIYAVRNKSLLLLLLLLRDWMSLLQL